MIGGIRKADNSHGIIVGHDLNISEVVAQLGLTMNTVPTPHRVDYSNTTDKATLLVENSSP